MINITSYIYVNPVVFVHGGPQTCARGPTLFSTTVYNYRILIFLNDFCTV